METKETYVFCEVTNRMVPVRESSRRASILPGLIPAYHSFKKRIGMSPSKGKSQTPGREKSSSKGENEDSEVNFNFLGLTESLHKPLVSLTRTQSALVEINDIFKTFVNEIAIFEKDFGTMQQKDNELATYKLALQTAVTVKTNKEEEAEKRERLARDEVSEYKRKQTELAEERAQFTEKLEEMDLACRGTVLDAEEKFESRYKQRERELHTKVHGRINSLETERKSLLASNDALQKKLKIAEEELAQKKKTSDLVEKTLGSENSRLEGELEGIKKEFAISSIQNDEYYTQSFRQLDNSIQDFTVKYFERLHEGAVQDPISVQRRLSDVHSAMAHVPISDTVLSQTFRISIAQHIIFKGLSDLVWQRFGFAGVQTDHKEAISLLNALSEELAVIGERRERSWRALTIQGLENFRTNTRAVQDVVLCRMIQNLKQFINDGEIDSFRGELSSIIAQASLLWKEAQLDSKPVMMVEKTKAVQSPKGRSSADLPISLCLFPDIIRSQESNGTTAPQLLYPGRSFSPDASQLDAAKRENEELLEKRKKAMASVVISPSIDTPPQSPIMTSSRGSK